MQRIRSSPLLLGMTVVLIVAGLVFAWWTISPLFIRTNLSEGPDIPVPAAQSGTQATPTVIGKTDTMEIPTAMPAMAEATPTAMATVDEAKPMEAKPGVLAVGNFDRKDDVHYANGQAIIARQDDGSTIVRLQDLDAANGPDLFVWVTEHPDPQNSEQLHQGGHNLGNLRATNGSFNYTLDPSIDPSKIKSVVIYCRAFSVIFSTAKLQSQ